MDGSRFDALARTLARSCTRRRLIGGLVAGVIGLAGGGRAEARTCTGNGTICREHATCCSGFCAEKDRTGRRRCDQEFCEACPGDGNPAGSCYWLDCYSDDSGCCWFARGDLDRPTCERANGGCDSGGGCYKWSTRSC